MWKATLAPHLLLRRGARLPGFVLAAALGLAGCYNGDPQGTGESASDLSASASESGGSGGESGDSGDSGDSDDSAGDDLPTFPFEPGPATLPRLTTTQYYNSLRDLFGEPLPILSLEPDTNPHLFFSIGAARTTISEVGVHRYEEAAQAIQHAIFSDPERREAVVGCVPEAADDPCAAAYLEHLGRRLFRRPLTAEEHARWLGVAAELADGDPWRGLGLATSGLLQSPHFLYRVELGETDPEDPSRRRYTGWELASRLAFLLWDRIPDDALLDAAAAGLLDTAEGIDAEAQRLLADPRGRVAIRAFFSQYLDLARLEHVERDADRYPLYTPALAAAMRTEVELLVDDLIHRQEADIRGLFTSRRTFVNDALAALYGVEAAGASPITFVPVELPEDGPRAGLLTLGAFLMMNAHATETSPTLRGKYVRERVLCEEVPAPPDDTDTNVPDADEEAKTLRERLEQHRNDPACAGCHAFIDPPGFLFEHFDSIGAFRELDNGYPIDASGDLDGEPLADARALAEALADDRRVARCLVLQLHRHTNGRLERPSERPGLAAVEADFAAAGYRFHALLRAFVTSEAFRTVATPEDL